MTHRGAYYRLAGMTGLSFISMYILMYVMVNTLDNVFNSVNQVYMAGISFSGVIIQKGKDNQNSKGNENIGYKNTSIFDFIKMVVY